MAQAKHQEKSAARDKRQVEQPLFLKLASTPPAKKP
jgi:hypothetical protein